MGCFCFIVFDLCLPAFFRSIFDGSFPVLLPTATALGFPFTNFSLIRLRTKLRLSSYELEKSHLRWHMNN